ncbi:ephrin type-B receptor 3-like [Xenia sp. Carnegie-2017]|uniref:ephrin type-B receptor 3-like n=1 Tax=Xenia sp. Carnegie-2017 TaxID=2897299 RepID=UPI001F04528A|nr:ephrin type-B receptor 3-like [Xenia sp. Carnegie-2017]
MSLRVLYSLCLWTLYIQQLQAGEKCEKNTYKDKAGNERCLPCPKNSISNDNQQGCSCEENHFRFIGENYTSPCYGIPTSVNELQYKDKDHGSVTLLWKPPTLYESLSSKIVIYEVDCFECSSSRKSALVY